MVIWLLAMSPNYIFSIFFHQEWSLVCVVTGARQYSMDLPQGGLEFPCLFYLLHTYFCIGVRNEYVPQALFALFFTSTSLRASLTFMFAATSYCCFSLKGQNYFKIDIACVFSHWILLVIDYPQFSKGKFRWIKLWLIALDLPKFSPTMVLHYTIFYMCSTVHPQGNVCSRVDSCATLEQWLSSNPWASRKWLVC